MPAAVNVLLAVAAFMVMTSVPVPGVMVDPAAIPLAERVGDVNPVV